MAVRAQQSPPAAVPGAPPGVTAFLHVNVVPMDSERVLLDHSVLIEGGRITALGPAVEVIVPADAQRIDGRGKYLMPGLTDMHAHLTYLGAQPENREEPDEKALEDKLYAALANGITTIRNLDHDATRFRPGYLLPLRARAAAGELWSPRIYTSGQWGPLQYLNPTFFDSIGMPLRLDSIEAYLRAYKAEGYDFVKLREATVSVFDSVLMAARRVGIPVVGHSSGSLMHAVAQGLRSVEHINLAEVAGTGFEEAAAAVKAAKIWGCVCPPSFAGVMDVGNPLFVRTLQAAGVGLLAGTDGGVGGSMHGVLSALVRQGLTPYEALATATVNPARYFATELNVPDIVGTVAVGNRADLILLAGNPLEDVGQTGQPTGVMIGGRWLEP